MSRYDNDEDFSLAHGYTGNPVTAAKQINSINKAKEDILYSALYKYQLDGKNLTKDINKATNKENVSNFLNGIVDSVKSGVSGFVNDANRIKDVLGVDQSAGSYVSGSNSSMPASTVSYLDAPLAEHYGMDAATAYQEALANNSVQRYVADLRKAGLNPVLAVGSNGAASFAGSSVVSDGYSGAGSAKLDISKSIRGIGNIISAILRATGKKTGATVAKGISDGLSQIMS